MYWKFVWYLNQKKLYFNDTTGTGRGLFGGDDRIVYWKCEAGQTLQENLHVPTTNKAREKALLMAAQQVSLIFTL